MKRKPLVSIIMPTYNCGPYIGQSIDSVLAQTIGDWELWIIDDCSTDDTKEILMPYIKEHDNIHYLVLKENGGPAAARNEGLKRAQGRYIAFLDSDDLWLPHKLERQIAYMEKTGASFCATAYEQMNEEGQRLYYACFPPEKTDYNTCIRLSNPLGNLTVMYDQKALGPMQVPLIRKRNDFALWLKILKKTKYCYGLEEVLALYRVRKNGSVSSNKLGQARYHWELYHQVEGHSLIRSIYDMGCWAFVKGTNIGLNRKKLPQDKIEVLVAAMHQTDHSLLDQMNIQSDVIVGNQCDHNSVESFVYQGKKARFLNFAERGVGLNRNNALMRATGDILLFADQDMRYYNGYEERVRQAWARNPHADVLIFNIDEEEKDLSVNRYVIKKDEKIGWNNFLRYGTVRFAVRLSSVQEKGIYFNQCFGGGARHKHGEDNIFLSMCLRNKLKVVAVPEVLAVLKAGQVSSWNTGYDLNYLKDQGCLYHAISRPFWRLLCLQNAAKFHKKRYHMSLWKSYQAMVKGYKHRGELA